MSDRRTTAADRKALGAEVDYLGDGVYVAHDGYGMWLTAEDGIQATDGIYIEPLVFESLVRFVARMKEPAQKPAEG